MSLSKVMKLAQGSAPDFVDVNFPVYPDLSQEIDLNQPQDSSFHFSDRAQQELASLPDVYREKIGQHLDDASDALADGNLRTAATCLVEATAVAHLQRRHHLAQEINTYRRAVALGGNHTNETGDDGDPGPAAKFEAGGKDIGYQSDNPTESSNFNGRIAATGGALEKVLALAIPAGIAPHLNSNHMPNLRMHLMQEHGGVPGSHGGDLEAAHQHLHAMGTAGHTHPDMGHHAPRVGLTAGRGTVALARPYEREERGRIERVSGYAGRRVTEDYPGGRDWQPGTTFTGGIRSDEDIRSAEAQLRSEGHNPAVAHFAVERANGLAAGGPATMEDARDIARNHPMAKVLAGGHPNFSEDFDNRMLMEHMRTQHGRDFTKMGGSLSVNEAEHMGLHGGGYNHSITVPHTHAAMHGPDLHAELGARAEGFKSADEMRAHYGKASKYATGRA